MSTIAAIKKRRSIRNYDSSKQISSSIRKRVQHSLDRNSSEKFRFVWISSDLQGVRLGTYGFIRGATNFIVGITKDLSKEVTVSFGQAFEEIILDATAEGLGTCWMAGSYNMKDFKKNIEIDDDEQIVIVSPIGYDSGERKMKDRFLALVTGNHKRKPWNQRYFQNDWSTPLDKGIVENYETPLEMVRLAPSTNNGQPWRIVLCDNRFHFYLCNQLTTKAFRGFCTGYNDVGIAMTHFKRAADELGLSGKWITKNPSLDKKAVEYICSWEITPDQEI